MKTSNEFVHSVMHALPERESLLRRVGRTVLQLILSPLWMWLCLIVVVAIFHQPLLAILSVLGEISLTGISMVVLSLAAFVLFISLQMIRDCGKYELQKGC